MHNSFLKRALCMLDQIFFLDIDLLWFSFGLLSQSQKSVFRMIWSIWVADGLKGKHFLYE